MELSSRVRCYLQMLTLIIDLFVTLYVLLFILICRVERYERLRATYLTLARDWRFEAATALRDLPMAKH